MRRLLELAVAAGMFPGAVALVREPGDETVVAVGKGRIGPPARAAAPDLVYDLASLTKPLVTTFLFLLACREGRLDLETRVEDVLPEAAGRPAGGLKIYQLLTHTSGLPAWRPLYALARGERRRVTRALLETVPVGHPGQQVIYSCPGFILLGWVLEEVTGRSLWDGFRELVVRPLGLEAELHRRPDPASVTLAGGASGARAELDLLRSLGISEAAAHLPPVGEGWPDDGNARFLGGFAGNAGLWGTARAVARLTAELLPGGGEILTSSEAALATRSWTRGMEQARGLGWQLAATPGCSAGPHLPPDGFGHTGFTGTSVWADPHARRILVLLANRHHPSHRGVDLHPLRRRFHTVATLTAP